MERRILRIDLIDGIPKGEICGLAREKTGVMGDHTDRRL